MGICQSWNAHSIVRILIFVSIDHRDRVDSGRGSAHCTDFVADLCAEVNGSKSLSGMVSSLTL